MLRMIAYTVCGFFTDPAVAEEWIAWLRDEHVAEVIAGGALDAEIVCMDRDPSAASETRCEIRYRFATRATFEAYLKDHAPRLRAEGLKRFPPERGIRYERTVGEAVCEKGG